MWDDMAKTFEDADFETMDKPVIIAVSSCRVTKFRGIQLLIIKSEATISCDILNQNYARLQADSDICNTLLLKPKDTRA